jgi:hypothetical protein
MLCGGRGSDRAWISTLLVVGGRPSPADQWPDRLWPVDPAQNGPVLYTVSPGGSHLLQVRPDTLACAAWSPDGKLMTTADSVMNGDGTGFRRLTSPTGPLNVFNGVWSADQKSIVVEGWNDTDPSQTGLWSMRSSDGGDLHQLTTSTNGGHDIPIGVAPDRLDRLHAGGDPPTRQPPPLPCRRRRANARQVGDIRSTRGDWARRRRSILVEARMAVPVDIAPGTATAIVIAASPMRAAREPGLVARRHPDPVHRQVDVGSGQTSANR